jgi:hypothetical protein
MDFGTHHEEMAMKCYIVTLLVKQAQSDHEFSAIEKKYLAYAGHSLGLSDAEIAAVRLNPEKYVIAPPPDESKRMTMLYFLLFMLRADGQVGAGEEQFCHHMGFRLGFRPEMVSNLIGVMKEFLRNDIPPNAMLEKVKPYLN